MSLPADPSYRDTLAHELRRMAQFYADSEIEHAPAPEFLREVADALEGIPPGRVTVALHSRGGVTMNVTAPGDRSPAGVAYAALDYLRDCPPRVPVVVKVIDRGSPWRTPRDGAIRALRMALEDSAFDFGTRCRAQRLSWSGP